MRYAAMIVGALMLAGLPADARAQGSQAKFEDHYADVNGMRLHYASVESNTRETAVRRAHTGFVDAEVKNGHYTEADRDAWLAAWSQSGLDDRGAELLPGEPSQSAVQRPASGVDDRPLLVREGSYRRREVDHH